MKTTLIAALALVAGAAPAAACGQPIPVLVPPGFQFPPAAPTTVVVAPPAPPLGAIYTLQAPVVPLSALRASSATPGAALAPYSPYAPGGMLYGRQP